MRALLWLCFMTIFIVSSCKNQPTRSTENTNAEKADTPVPGSVIVKAPEAVASRIDPTDSSCLTIRILPKFVEVSLLKDTLKTVSWPAIDTFIGLHQSQINSEKILLVSLQNEKNTRVKNLRAVLIKNGFTRIRIATNSLEE